MAGTAPSACVRLRDSTAVIWADGCTTLTRPGGQTPAATMMASQIWLQLPSGLAPTSYTMELLFGGRAQTIGQILVEPAETALTQHALAQYENGLRLVDVSWGSDVFRAGLWAVGSLVWQSDTPLPADLLVSIRLVDWLGRSVAEETLPLSPADYPNTQWPAGERVRSFMGMELPFALDGRYRVQVAVKNIEGAIVPSAGLFNRTWATIGTVQIEPFPLVRHLPEGIIPVEDVRFGETIRLLGSDLARNGDLLTVKLYWTADGETAVDYNIFVHVGQPGAPPLAQSSSGPANWTRPVSSWRPDEIIEDEHLITLPADLPADAIVSVGMFDPGNSDIRIPVTAVNQPVANDAWPLGPLPAK